MFRFSTVTQFSAGGTNQLRRAALAQAHGVPVRVGKTFGNLMVDVVATNQKLHGRVRRIVGLATGEPEDRVDEALRAAGGDAKVAIVSLLAGIDADAAGERLDRAQGVVRKALES